MEKSEKREIEGQVPFWFSSRMVMTVMTFLILLNTRAIRLNMSVAILCMVNHTAVYEQSEAHQNSVYTYSLNHTEITKTYELEQRTAMTTELLSDRFDNSTTGKREDIAKNKCNRDEGDLDSGMRREDGTFHWSKRQQGLILSAFYWGYVVMMIPCSWILNRFGTVRVLAIFAMCSSITCLAIPLVSYLGPEGVIVLRVFTGCLAGVYDAGAKNMISKWIPPSERARLGSLANTGSTIGTLVTFVSSGYLCKYGFADGWQSIFYLQGSFGIIIAFFWWLLIHETPEDHPRISSTEREYIQKRMVKNALSSQRQSIPWVKILTSKPVYAICLCAIAFDIYMVISSVFLPTYFAEVLKFQITSNGLLSSLPFIFQFLVQILAGVFSDMLLNHTNLTTGSIRKLVVGIGEVTCAASLIVIGFLGCEQATIAVVLVVVSFSSVGFIFIGYIINPIDIAPQFAGVLAAIGNFVSNMFSMALTLFITEITSQDSSRESWQLIFTVTAGIVLVTLVLYVCLASGEVQPWAIVGAPNNNMTDYEINVPLQGKESKNGDTPAEKRHISDDDSHKLPILPKSVVEGSIAV